MRNHIRALAIVGMLAPNIAVAADLYNPAAQEAPSIWRGLYLGGFAGGYWNSANSGGTTSESVNGLVAGGHLGGQIEIDHIVLGIEGDLGATSARGTDSFGGVTMTTELNSLASARGRFGFATGRTLIYATGGAAFLNGAIKLASTTQSASVNVTGTGYVAGVGIEMKVSDNVSARLEGLYYGFNNISIAGYQTPINLNSTVIRLGASYYLR